MNIQSKRVLATLILLASGLFAISIPTYAATTKPTPKASATSKALPNSIKSPGANAGNQGSENGQGRRGFGGAFANLTQSEKSCLQKNGFKVPTFTPRPSNSPRPSFSPGANNGLRRGNFDPTVMQKAFKACKIAVPTFGGNGGFQNNPKYQAFQKCMTDAGIKATNGRYDQSDPDTAAALIKCQKSTGFSMPTGRPNFQQPAPKPSASK